MLFCSSPPSRGHHTVVLIRLRLPPVQLGPLAALVIRCGGLFRFARDPGLVRAAVVFDFLGCSLCNAVPMMSGVVLLMVSMNELSFELAIGDSSAGAVYTKA